MSASTRIVVKDSNGITFDPASLPHSFTYDTNGNMVTDTCTEAGSIVRVKSFRYTQSADSVWLMATETAWVNQSAMEAE